ncbi:unnamed protein product [Prunus armeniaca]
MNIMKWEKADWDLKGSWPHGCALSGEICVSLLPRCAARSSRDTMVLKAAIKPKPVLGFLKPMVNF